MSGITITAGWSFSGGITITEAPAPASPENTAAWLGGGYNNALGGNQSSVNRITFATDTATASARGPLSMARAYLAAASNTTYGWWGGGYSPAGGGSQVSRVDRITFATDTATASVRGPLSLVRQSLGAAGNTDYGWFGGGYYYSIVDRITYATDTATASVRGPLTSEGGPVAAAGNTTAGWFSGVEVSTLARITYATDTATASVRGPLSLLRTPLAATGNTTDGWFGGGNDGSPQSRVDRITYATDTATASVRGPLSLARFSLAAAGNTTDGWFGGGYNAASSPGTKLSRVDRITFATDTATASVRGPLSVDRYYSYAAGGIQ